jgi:ribonuclease P protein component
VNAGNAGGSGEPMASFGFGRERRLRKRADFTRVQGSARRVTTRHYVFLLARQPSPAEPSAQAAAPSRLGPSRIGPSRLGPSRLGIVVTRKLGNAPARNRIKRVCRECFRRWPDLLPAGVDLVIIARQGADKLGLAEARAEWGEVSRLLRRRADEALALETRMPHVSGRPKPSP